MRVRTSEDEVSKFQRFKPMHTVVKFIIKAKSKSNIGCNCPQFQLQRTKLLLHFNNSRSIYINLRELKKYIRKGENNESKSTFYSILSYSYSYFYWASLWALIYACTLQFLREISKWTLVKNCTSKAEMNNWSLVPNWFTYLMRR